MRIAIIFFLTSYYLTFFVSCACHEQSFHDYQNKIPGKPTLPSNTAVPTNEGTADSGGGNTFMGKALESYKINPRNLTANKILLSLGLNPKL